MLLPHETACENRESPSCSKGWILAEFAMVEHDRFKVPSDAQPDVRGDAGKLDFFAPQSRMACL